MYNGSKVKPLGKCKVTLRNPRNQKLYQLEFWGVDKDCTVPPIGKRASYEAENRTMDIQAY